MKTIKVKHKVIKVTEVEKDVSVYPKGTTLSVTNSGDSNFNVGDLILVLEESERPSVLVFCIRQKVHYTHCYAISYSTMSSRDITFKEVPTNSIQELLSNDCKY